MISIWNPSQSMSSSVMLPIFMMLLSFVSAQAETASNTSSSATTGTEVVAAIILMVIGFALLFFGARLFRPILFLSGFVFFAALGVIILTRLEPESGYSNRGLVILLGSLAFGLVGGCLAMFLWRLGLSLIGASGGFALAMFILTWKSGGLIESETGRAIFVTVFAIIGAIIANLLEKPVVIVSTSIHGSYLLVLGIDVFAKTGFEGALRQFLSGTNRFNKAVFETNGKLYGLLITFVIITIVGVFVQFRMNRGREFRKL